MKQVRRIVIRLLFPPKPVLILLPPVVFAALIALFVTGQDSIMLTVPVYVLSAYCLTILVIPMPKLIRSLKTAVLRRLQRWEFGRQYCHDLAFRGSVSLYQGMFANFFYVIFRMIVGIRYASVWFLTMAVYYLVLGCLRLSLIVSNRRGGQTRGFRCYRRTAWLLFLLNIPMGGMILLMVAANSGYSYPGYVIYLSAMYTFYTLITAILNLVRFRRLGSPILSAAKVLNLVAALMSVLGLQTAMIAAFSVDGPAFRRMMNAITGGFVWGIVIVIAVYMLLHSRTMDREVNPIEQIRK